MARLHFRWLFIAMRLVLQILAYFILVISILCRLGLQAKVVVA